jgi:hypothetical protein
MAIVTGAGTIAPDYSIRLLFLGNVKLKYLVAAILFMYLISLTNGINEGGHYAHFGGALLGFIFVRQLQNGNDWSRPVNRVLDQITGFFTNVLNGNRSARKGPKVAYRDPKRRQKATQRRTGRPSNRGEARSDNGPSNYQERLDAILDKIKKTGYDSLDEEEKEFLFNASKK